MNVAEGYRAGEQRNILQVRLGAPAEVTGTPVAALYSNSRHGVSHASSLDSLANLL